MILMKFDIWKDIMSQSSYFKYRPDPVTLGGVGSGSLNLRKRLEWRGRVTRSALFGGVRGWGISAYEEGEFGASERARTMKIDRRVRELHKLT